MHSNSSRCVLQKTCGIHLKATAVVIVDLASALRLHGRAEQINRLFAPLERRRETSFSSIHQLTLLVEQVLSYLIDLADFIVPPACQRIHR